MQAIIYITCMDNEGNHITEYRRQKVRNRQQGIANAVGWARQLDKRHETIVCAFVHFCDEADTADALEQLKPASWYTARRPTPGNGPIII